MNNKTKTTKKARVVKSTILQKALQRINPATRKRVQNQMYLAVRIADILEEKGLRQKDLAEKLGKSPSVITRWLSGDHNFTIATLSEIEVALGVNLVNVKNKEAGQSPLVVIHIESQLAKAPPLQQWHFTSQSTSSQTVFQA